MANNLFQSFIDAAKTIAGYPITVANAVFMRNGKTLDETQEELNTILGTTDISKYGDGTVTGAVKAACDKANTNEADITDVNNKLGNTDISAIGDGTLTGGLATLNSNLDELSKSVNTPNITGGISIPSDNIYTFPKDGYLVLTTDGASGSLINVSLYKDSGVIWATIRANMYVQTSILYVKKGMKAKVLSGDGVRNAIFYSL